AQLEPVRSDELSVKLWKQESPDGLVLAPVKQFAAHYEKADWEQQVGKLPSVVPVAANTLPPREIVLGITIDKDARAFPQSTVLQQSPLMDIVGGVPIMFLTGPDQVSIRAVRRSVRDTTAEFFHDTASADWAILDSQTQSRWNFSGCAIDGPLKGICLEPVPAIKDYWFDWQLYHPGTSIYRH
ncbi:MAG: DUF3179 domain-containing (seleno)protein, partial [Acidobacteriaceae bacterium]